MPTIYMVFINIHNVHFRDEKSYKIRVFKYSKGEVLSISLHSPSICLYIIYIISFLISRKYIYFNKIWKTYVYQKNTEIWFIRKKIMI